MNMKTNKIIERNAELQEHLTKENKKYYGNLLVYIRVMSLIRDEKKSEEMLLEILEDILEGQEHGQSAEYYLGKNPKQVADNIIKELPINVIDTIKIIISSLGIVCLMKLIPILASFKEYIDIGNFLISGVYLVFLVIALLLFMGYCLYRYESKIMNIILSLFFGVGLVVFFLLSFQLNTGLQVRLSNNLGIFLILLALLIISYLFNKTNEKQIWIPFIPPIVISAIAGIIIRINFFRTIINTSDGRIGLAIVLIIGLLLQYLLMWFIYRKLKKND
uniref:PIL3_3 n=2 Tax=Lactococcus lactis TaxID=1358 RepID=G0WJK5_LACLL|nr:PIL3_3 [Lactococcus lactis subsp. lactis]